MTPTKPAGHEDVPELDANALRAAMEAIGTIPGAAMAIRAYILLDRSRRAKAPAHAPELAPDVKGLVERLRKYADAIVGSSPRNDSSARLCNEAAAALSRLSAPPAEAKPVAWSGSLEALREANIRRQAIWCPDETPDLSFRGNELSGEVGEACNVIKKLERERHNWRGSRDTVEHLAEELADVVICADLCAITAGIDLAGAVVAKFNATSDKVGIGVRLVHPDPSAKAAEAVPGMVLVPREPTAAMEAAARKFIAPYHDTPRAIMDSCWPKDMFRLAYKAMLAAPQPLSPGVVE